MCDCPAQIERAAATGNPGRAEYLATRCDREHQDAPRAGSAVEELRDIKANAARVAETDTEET